MDGIVKKLLLDVEAASQRPGAAESWAPVLTGVQGLLAAGLQGNRMVPPSVWDVVCAMGRAFPLLLQSGVEEAAATEGPEVPEQRWARSALSSGQLSTFLLKLPSQPQIFTAYSSSAPLRAPGAAARVAQALSQLHGLVAPPPRAEGSRDSAESPTTAADGCTVQAAASEASPTAASSSRASGSGASGRSPAPSCDGGSSVSVTAGADAAGGTSGGGVASAAAHYIETDEEALRRKSEREASAAARIQQVGQIMGPTTCILRVVVLSHFQRLTRLLHFTLDITTTAHLSGTGFRRQHQSLCAQSSHRICGHGSVQGGHHPCREGGCRRQRWQRGR